MSNIRPFSILMMCDYNVPTGFGVVGENIVKHLKEHFGISMYIDIVAVNYFGEVLNPDERTIIYPATKIDKQDDPDPFGRTGFAQMLTHGRYDFVFIINDIGVTGPYLELIKMIRDDKKKENKKSFKTIVYFPMDNRPVKKWFDNLDIADIIVTYTEWAKKEICALRPDLKTKIKVIYHGTDVKTFFPIPQKEKREFREAFFGENANKVIFTNINRNQPRKDIPSTINAFILYRLYNKKTFLYLHMHPEDTMGWNLERIMEQTDLKYGVDYMYTPPGLIEQSPDAGFMNCLYNASDFYITTTSGEGWGLGITEAMAAKLAIIAPHHTSISEICDYGTRAWLTNRGLHRPYITHYDNMIREGVDIDDFSDLMYKALTHILETQNKVQAGYDFVHANTWEQVCKKWIAIFENLL